MLDRRLGIPISLAVVYLEIGRRAGLRLEGVNFPGHFLVRAPAGAGEMEDLIVDPFHAGAILSEVDCRHLLRQHLGEEAAFDHGLLATATRQHIVVRMLVNLKRLYVRMRSFPQARAIADLLLAVDPSALAELRDRGLLAYHMEDFAAALKDLEAYLRLMPRGEPADPSRTSTGPRTARMARSNRCPSRHRSGNTSRRCAAASPGSIRVALPNPWIVWILQSKRLNASRRLTNLRSAIPTPSRTLNVLVDGCLWRVRRETVRIAATPAAGGTHPAMSDIRVN